MNPRFRPLLILARLLLVLALLLVCCQHKLIYFPRPYSPAMPAAFLKQGGIKIEARTGQGRQVAWLAKPVGGKPAAHLWIVCGGNGTLALELEDVMRDLPAMGDAVLYFDYPGYGECEGASTPGRLRDSLKALVPLAADACGIKREELATRGIVFGHSLGASVALIAAGEFGMKRAVLLSAFTSSMDMASRVIGLPLGFLVTHRFDNVKAMQGMIARDGKIWLLHGADDEIIPIAMGRKLSVVAPQSTTYTELPGVGHNDIFDVAPHAVSAAIFAAREN